MKTILNSVKTALLYILMKPIELLFNGAHYLFTSLVPDLDWNTKQDLSEVLVLALLFVLACSFLSVALDASTIGHAVNSASHLWGVIRSVLPIELSVMYIVCPAIVGTSYILSQSGEKSKASSSNTLDQLRSGHAFHFAAQLIAWFPELIGISTFVLTLLYVSVVETIRAALSMNNPVLAVVAANPVSFIALTTAYVSLMSYKDITNCLEGMSEKCKSVYTPKEVEASS